MLQQSFINMISKEVFLMSIQAALVICEWIALVIVLPFEPKQPKSICCMWIRSDSSFYCRKQ